MGLGNIANSRTSRSIGSIDDAGLPIPNALMQLSGPWRPLTSSPILTPTGHVASSIDPTDTLELHRRCLLPPPKSRQGAHPQYQPDPVLLTVERHTPHATSLILPLGLTPIVFLLIWLFSWLQVARWVLISQLGAADPNDVALEDFRINIYIWAGLSAETLFSTSTNYLILLSYPTRSGPEFLTNSDCQGSYMVLIQYILQFI